MRIAFLANLLPTHVAHLVTTYACELVAAGSLDEAEIAGGTSTLDSLDLSALDVGTES